MINLLTRTLHRTCIICYTEIKDSCFEGDFLNTQRRRERYRSELRADTLSAARKLIEEEGYEGLTIRKLAQRMECSPMALYTYFSDKQALLLALAQEGFIKLAKRLESTVRRDPPTQGRKVPLGYIRSVAGKTICDRS